MSKDLVQTVVRQVYYTVEQILTECRQLHHHLLIVCLGSTDLGIHAPLVLLSKHLGALAGLFELLIARLHPLDNLPVLLRTHLGQLNTHKHYV